MLYYQSIIAYDIEDNKIRTRLQKDLKALGMIAIQKSVMWGFLNAPEEKAARELLKQARATSAQNVLFMVRANLKDVVDSNCFGIDPQKLELPDVDKVI